MLSRSPIRTKPSIHLSKYRLLGLVGQGQFGQVFCAAHRQTGQLVALKNLEQNRFPTHQFLRELRFLLSLQHPNIVTCLAIEHTKTGRYLVMDYCEGGTLRGLMAEETHLRLDHSLKLVADILLGLHHAHQKGIVHCDIKPENILLRLDTKGWIAKISDFGVARLSQELAQKGGNNTGSPAYMAPERFYGQYSHTSDIYSVGIMLFEMLAGYRPFSGAPGALMDAHLNQVLKFPETIPTPLQIIIKKSLEKLSARRYGSAMDMLSDLHSAAKSMNVRWDTDMVSLDTPLIESVVVPLACSFQAQQEYPLKIPAHCVSRRGTERQGTERQGTERQGTERQGTERQGTEHSPHPVVDICYAGNRHLGYHVHHAQRWHSVQLPEQIHQIVMAPQGCFAVTTHAIYHITEPNEFTPTKDIVLVHQFSQDCLTTLASSGKWTAVVSDMRQVIPKSGFSTLSFHPLPHHPAPVHLATQPIRLQKAGQASSLLQAIALDSGHVAVFSDLPPSDNTGGNTRRSGMRSGQIRNNCHASGTYIEVIARRGKRLGALSLPVLLGHIVSTPTPYRLLATDQYDLYSILQIDLKPFRVERFAVQVVPNFIAAARWGAVVMNPQGHIVLLDESGFQVNRIEGPPHPTAIALFEPSGLLIATWEESRGNLYTVDLKELGVDIVF